MDTSEVIDIPDGKGKATFYSQIEVSISKELFSDNLIPSNFGFIFLTLFNIFPDIHIGVTVRHAIKLYSVIRDKWLLFCCRSASDKEKWLKAFSDERKLVAQDKNEGLEFTTTAKQLARLSAKCKRKRPPHKPRGEYLNSFERLYFTK